MKRTSQRRQGAYPEHVLRGMSALLQRHPWQADSALALLLFAFSLSQGGAVIGLALILAASVAVRRRYPVAAFALVAVTGAAQLVLGLPLGFPDLAIIVLLYTLAASQPRPVSAAGLVAAMALAAGAAARWAAGYHGPLDAAVGGLAGLVLAAWLLGDSAAVRRRYYQAIEERAIQAEAERDAQARIAVAAERARQLEERRGRLVEDSAARLRQIERDLHDGAQVRLAALAMTLGEIKEGLDPAAGGTAGSDGRVRTLADSAHRNAKEIMAELRDLARGIHPAALDRGLDAALSALAETSAVPASLSVSLAVRPSPAIESMAYFCVAELLANVAKHSGARSIAVRVSQPAGGLLITVTDDGKGEARVVPGGGLAGLVERVQTVDGSLRLDSPRGGPTTVTIELPGQA